MAVGVQEKQRGTGISHRNVWSIRCEMVGSISTSLMVLHNQQLPQRWAGLWATWWHPQRGRPIVKRDDDANGMNCVLSDEVMFFFLGNSYFLLHFLEWVRDTSYSARVRLLSEAHLTLFITFKPKVVFIFLCAYTFLSALTVQQLQLRVSFSFNRLNFLWLCCTLFY